MRRPASSSRLVAGALVAATIILVALTAAACSSLDSSSSEETTTSAPSVRRFPSGFDDTVAPTQPGILKVSKVTSTSASLSWRLSGDDVAVAGYRIYRGPPSAPDASLQLIATTDAVNHYKVKALYSGRAYKIGVAALDLANHTSPLSTTILSTPPSPDRTAPSPPSSRSVQAKGFSASRVDVIWGASPSTDISGYLVFRDGVQVGRVELPNGLRFSDNGLAASKSHRYSIKAVDAAGNVSAATTARSGSALAPGAILIARGPYLSRVTATSAVVSWWTNVATPGTVTWAVTPGPQERVLDPAGAVQHHSVVLRGLQPGTRYAYTVASGPVSDTGTFNTAAKPGTPFSFAVLGDFGAGGNAQARSAVLIAASSTMFIQTVGDNIYPSSGLPDPNFTTTYSDFDARFFRPFAAAVKSQPLFPVNGNQEYFGAGAFWEAFPMPGRNHSWYSYDWGDAHILVLDTEQPFGPGTDQHDFARADLAKHRSAAWRIVALQNTPYSSTTDHSGSVSVRQDLVPLFEKYDVSLVLAGNNHSYERSVPLEGGTPALRGAGITYVVTGAGGNGFNQFTVEQPPSTAFRQASYYEYLQVSVSAASLRVDAIRADTGAVFDSTTIPHARPAGRKATKKRGGRPD